MISPTSMDFQNWSSVAFLVLLAILIVRDRKNIEFKYGISIRRMKRGREWITHFGDKHRKFFSYFGSAAIVVGIIASVISFYVILQYSVNVIRNPAHSVPGLKLILPSVPSAAVCSFALCIPFWYWIIGILVVLVFHELSHAFVARSENIKIKSFGLMSILVLPGAFVEPDERQLKKSSSIAKLKIYAAGTFANFILSGIMGLIFLGIFHLFYVPSGVVYGGLIANSPAANVSLNGTIIGANGNSITSTQDFARIMANVKIGEKVDIRTASGIYTLRTIADPQDPTRGIIGIANPADYFAVTSSAGILAGPIDWVDNLFGFLAFINLGIGLINILPLKPLDGGLVYEELFKMVFKKNSTKLINAVSIITFCILLIAAIGPYILKFV